MNKISKLHALLPNNMEVRAKDQLFYVVIKSFQNKEGLCIPSLKSISERSGLSIPTIRTSIGRLLEKEYLDVKKLGRCNCYIFNTYKNFEPFSLEFLNRKDITPTTKAYLVAILQYMYKDIEGLGKISFSNRELSKISGVPESTIRASNNELEQKQYLDIINNELRDKETGCKTETKVFHLADLGQAIVWVLNNHEQRIQNIEQKYIKLVKALIKENQELKESKNKLPEITIE